MKKRILTLSLLMTCCFMLFLCTAKNSQAETYVSDTNWDMNKIEINYSYLYPLSDKNYSITLTVDTRSDMYGVCIEDAHIPGKEIKLPDKVEINGKAYPVTRFVPLDSAHGDPVLYQTVILPDSVKEVQLNCNWPNVQKINIPKSMKKLCIELDGPGNVEFVVPDSMEYYIFKNNALYSKKDPGKLVYPLNIPEKYTIAEGTTSLVQFCFYQNNVWRYVKEIICPASLKEIENVAFRDCIKLETVDMKKSKIKILKPGVFHGTSKLKKVLLPRTLKKIENNVFYNSGISQLSIPPEVSLIGDRTFCKCKKLKKVTFEGTKKMPKFVGTEVFKHTPSGIKFYVKNKKMAKQLKKRLKKSGVKKAKIYTGKKKKPVYKNING